jgi:Flp pilus assembly protein TadG
VSGTRAADPRRGAQGQALIEFALLVPVFALLLLGMLEFGFAFGNHLTLEYASREGARTGSALANGRFTPSTCPATDQIDPAIIAAVQRVLASPGAQVTLANVSQIQIWKATTSGSPTAGFINTWTNTGPNSGPLVDGERLSFSQASQQWKPCVRLNGASPDSIGISLTYTYRMITPLTNLMGLVAGPGVTSLQMVDQTVMALNPIG